MAYEEDRPEDFDEEPYGFENPGGSEGEDKEPEVDEYEKEALKQDLVDVKTLKAVLGTRGIRGVVVYCPDCEDDHYLGWDLLAGNLQQILESGEPPVHEPAWEPDPDEYVTWDYARGFLDGYETYPEERYSDETCGYCGNKLPEGGYDWSHCPTCGKDLAPINLIFELRRRGWTGTRIGELLEQSGFDPPLFDPDDVKPGKSRQEKPDTTEGEADKQ